MLANELLRLLEARYGATVAHLRRIFFGFFPFLRLFALQVVVLRTWERELHLSALNLFFLTCIRCTCWGLMGRFFVQDMPASLTHVLDNEF